MSSSIKSQTAAKSLVEEDYPLSPVPWSERRSIWSLAPLLMGFALTSTTLFAGGKVGPAFRFAPDLISIILIGNLILGLYCSALGYIAYKSGLSTVLMARFSFGNIGSRWVDFILGFTEILRKAPLLEDGDAEQRRDSANLSGSRPRDFQHILYILY
ncbi:cytosine permease [Phormidesmis sp. 146-35]